MALIPDDAHVMLAAAVSTKNVILIADTIMCITDLVNEIQSRFTVAVRPGMGRSMTFGPAKMEAPISFPCSTCDKKCKSMEELNAHSKTHTVDEDVRSATQRLHSLTSSTLGGGGGSVDNAPNWAPQSAEQSSPGLDIKPSAQLGVSAEVLNPRSEQEESKQADDSAALKCPICHRTFNKIFLLNIHLSKHQQSNGTGRDTPSRTYSCRLCSKEFNHISNRAKHERICKLSTSTTSSPMPPTNSASQIYSCRKCRKPYADNANRLRHERLCQTTNKNRCLAYTTLTPSKPSGASGGSNSLELPISVNNYKQMASSAAFMKVLDENGKQINMFSCIICAKLLQTRTSLESHYMSHLGIKPHACQFCGKRFTDSSNWRKHQRGCTERAAAETGSTSGLPTMAPPLSGHSFSMDVSASSEYLSSSSSPTYTPASTSGADSQQSHTTTVKLEAVDITSDNESPSMTRLTFSDEHGEGQGAEVTADANESQPVSVASAEMEESEEQRDINTANSVVVDSALSWFVSDREPDNQSQSNDS